MSKEKRFLSDIVFGQVKLFYLNFLEQPEKVWQELIHHKFSDSNQIIIHFG
jgi:hypothetical protein